MFIIMTQSGQTVTQWFHYIWMICSLYTAVLLLSFKTMTRMHFLVALIRQHWQNVLIIGCLTYQSFLNWQFISAYKERHLLSNHWEHGQAFRFIGPLWGESTDRRACNWELWCSFGFSLNSMWNKESNHRWIEVLWRPFDVPVMNGLICLVTVIFMTQRYWTGRWAMAGVTKPVLSIRYFFHFGWTVGLKCQTLHSWNHQQCYWFLYVETCNFAETNPQYRATENACQVRHVLMTLTRFALVWRKHKCMWLSKQKMYSIKKQSLFFFF